MSSSRQRLGAAGVSGVPGAGSRRFGTGTGTGTGTTTAAVKHDAVSLVAQRLSKDYDDIPSEVWDTVRDSLRLLKIKYPIGSFLGGRKQDNERRRAVALLEYQTRQYYRSRSSENGSQHHPSSLSFDKLAKIAGMKLKDFKLLHETIGNFQQHHQQQQQRQRQRRQQSTTSATTTRNRSSSSSSTEPKPTTADPETTASTKTPAATTIETPTTIPSLAIQLGAFVQNSATVASLASTLYQQIVVYAKTQMKPRSRLSFLQDLTMYQVEYEAACFFVVATSRDNLGVKQTASQRLMLSANAMPGGGRGVGGVGIGGADHYHDDDMQQLDLNTMLDVCSKQLTNSSRFQMILDYVRELQKEMKDVTVTGASTSSSSNSTNKRKASSVLDSTSTTKTTKQNIPRGMVRRGKSTSNLGDDEEDEHDEGQRLLMEMMITEDTTGETTARTSSRYEKDQDYYKLAINYSPLFLEWKRKKLLDVLSSQQPNNTSPHESPGDDDNDDNDADADDHSKSCTATTVTATTTATTTTIAATDDDFSSSYDLKMLHQLDHAASEILQSLNERPHQHLKERDYVPEGR